MFFRYRGYNRMLVQDPYEDLENMWNRELLEVDDDALFDRANA